MDGPGGSHRDPRGRKAGFTLFEALVALVLSGLIVSTLVAVAGQWIPNWRRNFAAVQSADDLGLGLDRITADIASAKFVTMNGTTKDVLFEGSADAVTFVRRSIEVDSAPHLDVVRLSRDLSKGTAVLIRSQAAFTPLADDATPADYRFADPVVLVRAPFQVSFSYAGPDRLWRDAWGPGESLPHEVRISVRNLATGQRIAMSTATMLHVDLSPDCLLEQSQERCALVPSKARQSEASKRDDLAQSEGK